MKSLLALCTVESHWQRSFLPSFSANSLPQEPEKAAEPSPTAFVRRDKRTQFVFAIVIIHQPRFAGQLEMD